MGVKVEGRKRNLVALVNKLNVVYLIIIVYHNYKGNSKYSIDRIIMRGVVLV